MKALKKEIFFILLFMVIGIAAVTTNVVGNMSTTINNNPDDFLVYFSDVKVNGTKDLSLVKSENELVFDGEFSAIGDKKVITYDVTNASKDYDAEVSISCTNSTTYLYITNSFDMKNALSARSTRTGTLTIELSTAVSNEITQDVTCTITANAVERDSQGSGDVILPIKPIELSTGDVISIAGENFNVISQTDTTVTMLAQYSLGSDYRQNSIPYATSGTPSYVNMESPGGWGDVSVATEIDLYTYSLDVVVYLDNYVNYLKEKTKISDITGTLITVKELGELGCSINKNYASNNMVCEGTMYASLLINNQFWLTRSADALESNCFWAVDASGKIISSDIGGRGGVRPVITVPIEIARKYYEYKWYNIGDEIAIEDEMFNVISDNSDTITMLAQYNLGTNYRQSASENGVYFSGNSGWEYSPGPKEIDIQIWTTNPKTYVMEYVTYLKRATGDATLAGDLISVRKLGELGCTVPIDYSLKSNNFSCKNSSYSDWLINGQTWWTRSALADSRENIITVDYDAALRHALYDDGRAVRPVITISKEVLTKNVITFTIEGVEYRAYEGMYWSEWVNSPFNTGGFNYYEDEYNFRVYLVDEDYYYNDSLGRDSIIIDGEEYIERYSSEWRV